MICSVFFLAPGVAAAAGVGLRVISRLAPSTAVQQQALSTEGIAV